MGEVIQFEGLPPVEPDEEVNPNRQDFALGKVRGRNARDRGGCRRLPGECLHDQCRKCTVKSLKNVNLSSSVCYKPGEKDASADSGTSILYMKPGMKPD